VSDVVATQDGFLAWTMGWGGSSLFESADGVTWSDVEPAAITGEPYRYWADDGRLMAAVDLGGRAAVWASTDGGETWTATGGLPSDGWDVESGPFGMIVTGDRGDDWWDRSRMPATVVEQDGHTLSIRLGRRGCVVTGPGGDALLAGDCPEAMDGPEGLAMPPFITADHDRGAFTVADPDDGEVLMTITYREMQDAFEQARRAADIGPDAFVSYSADGSVWSEQSIAALSGWPGWVGPIAVADDHATLVISELDGPSSIWRITADG
jgi:hypothetical protein